MRLTFAFSSALATMLIFGGFDMVRGIAAPDMQRDWHLSYLQLSDAFMANSVGYLAGSFISGWFVARLGTRKSILLGAGLLAVGTTVVVAFSAFWAVVVGFVVSGLATGCLEIAVNQVVPEMTKSSTSQARYFNALHGFYGIGSFIYPVVAAALIAATTSWRSGYWLLLALLCVLLIAVWWWPGERRRKASRGRQMDSAIANEPVTHTAAAPPDEAHVPLPWLSLSLLMVTLLAYTMAESIMGNWLPTYLVEVHGYRVLTSSYALSGFYGMFTIGRLTAPMWVHRIGRFRSVALSAALALITCSLALFGGHGPWLIVLFCLSGLGFAAVFPTITAIASAMDTKQSGRVLGILFTVAGFAGLFANGVVGAISTAYSLSAGFSIIVILLALVLVGVGCVAALRVKNRYTEQYMGQEM